MTIEDMGHGVKKEHMGYASPEQVAEYCKKFPGNRCWSCKFFDLSEPLTWERYRIDGEVHGAPTYSLDGYCRCHSPRYAENDEGDPTAVWPWVDGNDWCGEYQSLRRAEAIENMTFDIGGD